MIRRYTNDNKIRTGRMIGTPKASRILSKAVRNGTIRVNNRVLKEGERLDSIAGELYGDARLWWIIAACSGVGWALQAPGGTILKIPASLAQVRALVG
ncbi:MAG: hypothetical protein CMA72_06825 [Euryarchaeota archaeon]|nr:hypothetical protein [Euryarchaeota archaeon]